VHAGARYRAAFSTVRSCRRYVSGTAAIAGRAARRTRTPCRPVPASRTAAAARSCAQAAGSMASRSPPDTIPAGLADA